MVSAATRQQLAVVLALITTASLSAKELADYRVGDTVEENITTPIPLRVVDVPGTDALREKELARIPIIFKFDPDAADKAERDLRAAFALTRSNFLKAAEEKFPNLLRAEGITQSPSFQQFVASFQKGNKSFPVSTNLAELWATGDTGRAIQSDAIARLRQAQERLIRLASLPPDAKPGSRVRLVPVTNINQALNAETVERLGTIIPRTNMIALSRVRTELTNAFPAEDRALAKFAASLLRANCVYADVVTEKLRAKRTESLFVADNFDAGQVVAKRGATVDVRLKGVLDVLRDKTAATRLAKQVSEEQARAEQLQSEAKANQVLAEQNQARADEERARAAEFKSRADRNRRRNIWLAGGLAVALSGSGILAWRLVLARRKRRRPSLMPVRVAAPGVPTTVITCPSCDQGLLIPADASAVEAGEWRQRALAAEQQAARAHAALRSGALAQFAQWLKLPFVRGLVTDRSQMLDAQKAAAAEMAELDRRLDQLHAPLQERLRAYEKRVTELEKTLAAKGAENRELIEAKIQLTRKQMEAERARQPVGLN